LPEGGSVLSYEFHPATDAVKTSGRPTDGNNQRRRHRSDKVRRACGFLALACGQRHSYELKRTASCTSRAKHFRAKLNTLASVL